MIEVQNTRPIALKATMCLSAALLSHGQALAQTDTSADGNLQDIVVTAQRREQSLQSIPVAVTAIGEAEIKARNLQDVTGLVGLVPGFSVRDAGQITQYNMRGYISTDERANSDNPVVVYIDDVVLGATVLQQMPSLDVQRVEALRGPQGTLFGRNAVGGLIHFVSNKPTDQLDGYAALQYGSFNKVIADGAVGGPLGAAFSGRVALKYDRDDGTQKNLSGGKDRNAKNALTGRVQIQYEATPNLTVNLSFQADRERNQYQGYSSFGTLNAAATALCNYKQIVSSQCFLGGAAFSNVPAGTKSLAVYNPRKIYSTLRSNPDHFDAQLAILRFDWSASPALKISSITAWAHGKRSFIEDDNSTGLPENNPFNILGHNYGQRQITQELRASGDLGAVNYVAGLFYLNSRKRLAFDQLDETGTDVVAYLAPHERLKTETAAAFAQADIEITPTLTATVGGRYTWERKSLRRFLQEGFVTLDPVEELPRSSGTVSRFTGKLGLQWAPGRDFMLYGHVSNGFKSGEYPADSLRTPLVLVKAETITAFEVGQKATFFNNRLRVNISAFINKIKGKQASITVRDENTGGQVPYFVNFGDVDQKGFEAEIAARPTESLTIGGSVAYVDNEIKPIAGVSVRRLAFFNTFSLVGNQLPGVPPWQETVYAEWKPPADLPGTLAVRVDWRWQSKLFWTIANSSIEREPAFDVGDVRITYTAPSDRWSLTGFVTNITKTRYSIVNFSFGGSDVLTVQWGRPRTAGIRAAVNF